MTNGSPFQKCVATRGAIAIFVILSIVPSESRAATTGTAGGGQPIDTMQPSLALTALIAKDGVTSGPETGGVSAGGATMIGEIRLFGGSIVPGGFLAADGSLVTIASAPNLYAVIGVTYGGDGVTTFRVPDLRARANAGRGQGPGLTTRVLGESFGGESVTQSTAQLPAHTHTVAGASTGSAGSGQGLPTIQPTLAVHPIICPFGSFEYLPEIRLFAAGYGPGDWMSCEGQALSIDDNTTLYIQLGTVWGGDGQDTFNLPDLRGRVALGSGTGPGLSSYTTGDALGTELVSMTEIRLTSHTHPVPSGSTGSAGSGLAFTNHQPTVAMRYIIAVNGIVPTTGSTNATSTPTIGEIRPFASENPPPAGWMAAQGQVLTTASNPSLFGVIGNAFGGDGVSTFALPDLRGRAPIGVGQGTGTTNRVRGDRPGTESTAIAISQMAAHVHTLDPNGLRHPGEPSGGGAMLLVRKNASDPTKIDLSWGAGCPSGVTGYAVYQGTIGFFTSHSLFAGACDIAATSLISQTPGASSSYYLVSAIDGLVGEEGSLGRSTSGEIPRPPSACAPTADLAPCN